MKNMKIINCTPHPVNIIFGETFPVSGILPRVKEVTRRIGNVNNIPLLMKSLEEVENLPVAKEDTVLIVSALVAQACPDRDDLIVPNVVRDSEGKIIGCDSFSILKQIEEKDFEIL